METKTKNEIILTESQLQVYETLKSACDFGIRRGTICLIGDFQSGKTTLVKYLLSQMFDDPDKYYLNVNLYLLEYLRNEKDDQIIMSAMKARTRLMMEVALDKVMEERFKERNLMVMDAIEMIYPYNLNLVSLVSRHTRDGKVCVICVPQNDKFVFDFSWGNCEIIKL